MALCWYTPLIGRGTGCGLCWLTRRACWWWSLLGTESRLRSRCRCRAPCRLLCGIDAVVGFRVSIGDVGMVAVVPVGMAQVSSVNMIAVPGSQLLKGDEFGYFMFGGSDIIMLYQKGKKPQINTSKHYRLYGSDLSKGKK